METLPARSGTTRQAEKARRNDEAVVVRAVTSQDGDALRAMLDRLSPTTIYGRFHAAYRRVPEWMAAHL
jgi:predicted component of type VI protein secretion system